MASKSSRPSSASRNRSAATSRQVPWGLVAATAALAIFVVGVIGFAVTSGGTGVADPGARIEGVKVYETSPAGQHTAGIDDTVEYATVPPYSGEHNGLWQNCGVYTEPVQSEKAVHSLEHGAAWITYQPSLPADQVAELTDRVDGQQYMMISPLEGQDSPIVVTAWDRQIFVDSADDDRIGKFIDAYRNGPTTPERGATCDNGVGQPVDRAATVNPDYASLQQAVPQPEPTASS